MNTKQQIIIAAEQTFDRHGFTASGMDRLTDAANVSSRTLYKHLGNKNKLMAAALKQRRERFFLALDVESVDALFARLADWSEAEDMRGCLFLRALGDTGAAVEEVKAEVAVYRQQLRHLVANLVVKETSSEDATDAVLVIFEGAVSAASYCGIAAIQSARASAAVLLKHLP
ncbi:TetR/AcrR family transcriptional regulator [Roseobacter weihaiensis]|uniref:TetR/AcrR family transcriptional regulator n=1 Tax=Roseobacter weihaiensis TaxID=2763262 RepID=UPI001D0B7E16|nr:TetR/AcrR family transcriptional regulator [Roseobacter sp. H9]